MQKIKKFKGASEQAPALGTQAPALLSGWATSYWALERQELPTQAPDVRKKYIRYVLLKVFMVFWYIYGWVFTWEMMSEIPKKFYKILFC